MLNNLHTKDSVLGIVLVDHGSRRDESNVLVEKMAKLLQEQNRGVLVEPAHMELAEPSLEAAFALCVAQGAQHVIVMPYFLGPGRHVEEDIPHLAEEAAKNHPGVSHSVAPPLGLHSLIIQVIEERIYACIEK